MAILTALRRRVRKEDGAELIEMALVLPLLLLMILGIVDFGFLFRKMNIVTNAAREGARAGILPGYDADDVTSRVQDYLNAGGLSLTCPSSECVVSAPTASVTPVSPATPYTVREVQVTIFHQYPFLAPIAALTGGSYSSVALTGRSVMRVE